MTHDDLSHEVLDQQCSIRFQKTFLPVSAQLGGLREAVRPWSLPRRRTTCETDSNRDARAPSSSSALRSLAPCEGCRPPTLTLVCVSNPASTQYQTRSDTDPRNLVLLSTTQGVAFQVDGAAGSKLFHHHVDAAGKVHRHWLEAERTAHQVGGAQTETLAEQADALARGKATACVIGPQCMGTRFNVLMTVQVPLKQQMPSPRAGVFGCAGFGGGCLFGGPAGQAAFGAAPKAAAPKAPAAFGAAMT